MGFLHGFTFLEKSIRRPSGVFGSRQKEGKCANLNDANLREVDLVGKDLRGADLSGTNLSGANLEDATLMEDQLITAVIDEFTVLPDGSKG